MAKKDYLSPEFGKWAIDCQDDVIFASTWNDGYDYGGEDVEILN